MEGNNLQRPLDLLYSNKRQGRKITIVGQERFYRIFEKEGSI